MSSSPSFTRAVEDADRIIIGTVTDAASADYAPVFVLEIQVTLRGEPAASTMVTNLVSNPVCGTLVLARNGDRIAIAFNGQDFSPPATVNAVAYLAGTPPASDIEILTEDAIRHLVDGGVPDTATVLGQASPVLNAIGVSFVLLALLAIADSRRRRSRRRA